MKMQKSKSHSFVIFPSSVRTIPFTVPRLPTSSSYPPSSSSSSSSPSPSSSSVQHSRLSTADLRSCSRNSHLWSCRSQTLTTSSLSHVRPNRTTMPNLPHQEESHSTKLTTAPGERWASVPCFLPFQGSTEGKSFTSASLRRKEYESSNDDVARRTTVDLEHANLLFGIDPCLYLSTESVLDDGSTTGGCQEMDDDGGGGGGGDEDDYSSGVYDESNVGRVWFALEYDPDSERLLFSLLRIRNLPNSFSSNQNSRDPIVRVWLMPDERRWVQTKFKKKSCNHRFNENFYFQVSFRDFASRSIKLAVYGTSDRHNRRQQPFAYVIYPLKDHVSEPNERIVVWRDLEKETTSSQQTNGDAQLYLSLSYDSEFSRLNVALHSGKNFPPSEDETQQSNEFYVVVSQVERSKVIKKKKTSIVKQIINFSPIFNELFHFKVHSNSLDLTSLLITAMRNNPGHKDTQIGRLVLGSFMFARGEELDHWNAMLTSGKQSVARWHILTN